MEPAVPWKAALRKRAPSHRTWKNASRFPQLPQPPPATRNREDQDEKPTKRGQNLAIARGSKSHDRWRSEHPDDLEYDDREAILASLG